MSGYKVVGITTEDTKCFSYLKVGRQAKKRAYVCREHFLRYAPKIVRTWGKFLGLKVEAYKMVSGKWVKCELPGGVVDEQETRIMLGSG